MIDTLKNTSVVVCVCCVVCSILSVIAPAGRMKKTVNLVFGLFLIVSLVIPIISLFSSLSTDLIINEHSSIISTPDENDFNNMVLKNTADNLVKVTDELLASEGVHAKNIEISIRKTKDNSIYISLVNIYITKEYKSRAEDIRNIVYSNLSKDPVIICYE